MDSHVDLLDWMVESKLIDKSAIVDCKSNLTTAELAYLALNKAAQNDKVMLLDYEWAILPREYIKITVVTDREKKEFTYNL
jgi:hypothetical protein